MLDRLIVFADEAQPTYNARLSDQLGGKGASLSIMTAHLGLPVPPAFTLTVSAFHKARAQHGLAFLKADLRTAIAGLERRLSRGFGAGDRPLIVSVRSGAPVSMPGMMDTILNLGLNAETAAALAREIGHDRAMTCHARFKRQYEEIVGAPPSDDVWDQLHNAVGAVFASWDSPRAKTYRARAGIDQGLGTAASVQAMVFGTAPGFSGTGVAFTRDPSTGAPGAIGDWLENAQGEDVVAGTHLTAPLAAIAQSSPEIWSKLQNVFVTLERHYQDLCDVEFTVESGKLWVLQARIGKRSALAAARIAVDKANSTDTSFSRRDAIRSIVPSILREALESKALATRPEPLTVGVAASPGIASGRVRFTADDAVDAFERGESVILVRQETSPSDVHGMSVAEGILTATGGLVSHAAIVAREWGKPAVVGASAIKIGRAHFTIGGVTVAEGGEITIDGTTGQIFLGLIDTSAGAADPFAVALLEWAREIGGASEASLDQYEAVHTALLGEQPR